MINLNSYRECGESLHTNVSDELPAGTVLLHGQYTIDEYLNSGGFGITYKAKDSLGRLVVIKECYPGVMCLRKGTKVSARSVDYKDELAGMITGFVSEAHNLAALTHKNIVHVHQVFEENDTAYMAIDYIEGKDLLERIEMESNRLIPKEIVDLTKRILPAVRYIHGMGMLHRDISPDNILIDESGEPILIDFGAARKTAPSSRRAISKMKFVKDGYSPQEFYIAGADQGPWSDIYSLAASLYHAISGRAPEDSQKRMSALAQKLADPYVPLAKRTRGYPAQFLETIDAALQVDPRDRIQSADEWIRRLANRPVTSQPHVRKTRVQPLSPANPADAGKSKGTEKPKTLPELLETSVRQEILSGGNKRNHATTSILFGGVALALLVVAGTSGYLVVSPATEESAARKENTVAPSPISGEPTTPIATNDNPTPAFMLPIEGQIASDTAAQDANLDIAEDLAVPTLPTSALVSPPARPDSLVVALAAPFIALPKVAELDFSFDVTSGDQSMFAVALDSQPTATAAIGDLEPGSYEANPAIDTRAPDASALPSKSGAILVNQIIGSHWDVDMPFQSDLVQVRNSNTIQITELTDTADLLISGTWIKEGTTIYAFNGETLLPETPLSVSILNTMKIDPDGYVRATVRYKDPESGLIDRGLLAVPVFRQITLTDTTVLEARVRDLRWKIEVTETAAFSNGLEVGDILLGEKNSGIGFVTHDDLAEAISRLERSGLETARFEVRRGSQTLEVSVPLGRSNGQGRD